MMKVVSKKIAHFETCIDENCERKWCVERRNAPCYQNTELCETKKSDRCIRCHTKYFCTGYGWCELHGDHGP